MSDIIDLRSDTVTRPGAEMRAAMANAVVGDDVYGDDSTVHQLEAHTALLLGKDAALLLPSGTQSNLCALLAHCQRGEEYIVGQNAHTYKYEAGGAAVLGSIQPQPIEFSADGTLDLDIVRSKVKPDDEHFARTKLLALENTTDGKVLPLSYLHEAGAVAREFGLSYHLDGARVWNAAAELDVDIAEIVAPFDSISVCLSKGLGAPMGSVLVGNAPLIASAKRWRKMLGGGLRQAGIIAAAGIYALEHHRKRLVDDHAMARSLGDALSEVNGVDVTAVNTNMVFADFANFDGNAAAKLDAAGIVHTVGQGMSRLVAHLDLPANTPDRVADALKA